jgi:hypothetical protein
LVLKSRRLSGIESLILREPSMGTFAVLRDWTDLVEFSAEKSAHVLDFRGLLQLCELLDALSSGVEKEVAQ